MGRSARALGPDEHDILRTRTHAKRLVLPALALVLLGALIGGGAALVPGAYRPVGQLAVVAAGLVLVVWWVLVPFLRWRTTTYILTDRRLLTSTGVLTRRGREIPLNRVLEVTSERSLTDRMLGCGTLHVQTAAEDGPLVLDDVPDVEQVHREITALLFSDNPYAPPVFPPRAEPTPAPGRAKRRAR